jgi:hypothetical protein
LIAVAGCWPRGDRTQAQRETWATDPATVFFVGKSAEVDPPVPARTVPLDVDDSYAGLPEKVRAICRWALENHFDELAKVDDDVLLLPERLDGVLRGADYVGRFRTGYDGFPDYASGFTYLLSRKAMELIAAAELTHDTNEDRWVGTVLYEARVRARHESRFCCPFIGDLQPCGERIFQHALGREGISFAQLSPANIRDCWKWKKIINPPWPLPKPRKRRFR